MRHRVAGIIIKDGAILMMRRVKNSKEYYVFPGGGVEEGESLEEALKREIKEETSLDAKNPNLLFELKNQLPDQDGGPTTGYPNEHYFLIADFSGKPELGGPEKGRMDGQNQYFLEWLKLEDTRTLEAMDNLYPREAVKKLSKFLSTQK